MSHILNAVKEAKEKSKERKFKQGVDLAISLKGVDLKKPENKFKEEVVLSHGRVKAARITVIGAHLASAAKGKVAKTITETELTKVEKDAKATKKLAEDTDFFIAEPQLMARIGKSMGRVLGSRGKMPRPLPGTVDPKGLIARLEKTVVVALKEDPVIQCGVGSADLDDKHLEEHIKAVLHVLETKLPNGNHNIGSVYVKTTMGPAVRIK